MPATLTQRRGRLSVLEREQLRGWLIREDARLHGDRVPYTERGARAEAALGLRIGWRAVRAILYDLHRQGLVIHYWGAAPEHYCLRPRRIL